MPYSTHCRNCRSGRMALLWQIPAALLLTAACGSFHLPRYSDAERRDTAHILTLTLDAVPAADRAAWQQAAAGDPRYLLECCTGGE